MITAPFGSWSSPVTIATMTGDSVTLGSPTVLGPDLYWTESRADQGGRTTLVRLSGDVRTELTPEPYNVRSRVHEYGGGEYAVGPGVAVFSNFTDGRLYVVRGDQPPTPLSPSAPDGQPWLRFADLRVYAERDLVLAVREDHRGPGEPVNTLVALQLSGDNPDGGTVLCWGADFYAGPELGPDQQLAWVEWNHPAMPWDATRIRAGRLAGDTIEAIREIAGGAEESAIHPQWAGDGRLVFLSDRTGWWNLYAHTDSATTALHPAEHDFCLAPWRLGQHPYAVVDEDRLLVTWHDEGVASVGMLRVSANELALIAPLGTGTASVSVHAGRAAAVLTSPESPPRLAASDLSLDGSCPRWTQLRRSSVVELDPGVLSRARPVTWPGDAGPVHGWFYPPTNAAFVPPDATLPPLITLSHGGPTGFASADFNLQVQYWTSRGVAILDVNYGGSAGYGRAYRERLRGRWGLVDVADCASGAAAMASAGLADPRRLAIAGGSAGGYTTLRALTATDVFSAGISRYGVGDLEGLVRDTHKFEARYLDGLVGPYPAAVDVYRDRSPVHHVDELSAPILLLQGAEDQVVPPNQAEAMAAAARAKGLPVALIVFPGEGHGFRRAENIRTALEAELYFLGRVFGFTPDDDLPTVPIDNLDTA